MSRLQPNLRAPETDALPALLASAERVAAERAAAERAAASKVVMPLTREEIREIVREIVG